MALLRTAAVVLVVVFGGTILGFVQEYVASSAIEKLRSQVVMNATVVRGGRRQRRRGMGRAQRFAGTRRSSTTTRWSSGWSARSWRSRPGKLLLIGTALVIALTLALPFLPFISVFGFVALPAPLMLAKRYFYARPELRRS